MKGGDVLKFMRSRHGSGEGDVSRGKRQQEVLIAIAKKVLTIKTIKDFPQFFTQLSTYIKTDIDASIVQKLLPLLDTAKQFQTSTINLSPTNVLVSSTSKTNGYIMIPKKGANSWDTIHTYIQGEMKK
jgi:anionic cell wall polymer biosynthesis LytR-Cps2A-Psr (LCP) family protein